MRKYGLITAFSLFVLTACVYDAPLVGEASLPIDQALLGTWESIPEGTDSVARIVVRQDSANQYEIEYGEGESIFYFKCWLAELEGIRFMQLELIGDDERPVEAGDTDLFSVASYALNDGELVVRMLNSDVIKGDLADTAALQEAFAANRDNPDLFEEPGQFRKLPEDPGNFVKKW